MRWIWIPVEKIAIYYVVVVEADLICTEGPGRKRDGDADSRLINYTVS